MSTDLQRLRELHAEGALTDEQYARIKASMQDHARLNLDSQPAADPRQGYKVSAARYQRMAYTSIATAAVSLLSFVVLFSGIIGLSILRGATLVFSMALSVILTWVLGFFATRAHKSGYRGLRLTWLALGVTIPTALVLFTLFLEIIYVVDY